MNGSRASFYVQVQINIRMAHEAWTRVKPIKPVAVCEDDLKEIPRPSCCLDPVVWYAHKLTGKANVGNKGWVDFWSGATSPGYR